VARTLEQTEEDYGAMFKASVPDDFFEDDDKKSYSILESCNIPDAFEEYKEEWEDGLRISQGLTQKSSQERFDEVL